ncbi:hypothetical protein HYDPIDRAFT_119316 [Hydnomerulius pinastri MD-312]|uniref:Uncharacterized protein n=1 Tax=Hydnomerulius pinastri MD-312 TaxID=994086 RepID=A0A0C9VM55_9AGAM|nr:hypothetical protein HYDPIDRAFT_119316 [Hydnomerulius pinastri MD-312]
MKFILSPTATAVVGTLLTTRASAATCTFEFWSGYIIYSAITSDQAYYASSTKILNSAGAEIGSMENINLNAWNSIDSQLPYTVDFDPQKCGPGLNNWNHYTCTTIPFKYAGVSFDMTNGPGCTYTQNSSGFDGESTTSGATYSCPFAC